jgi:hypothetical protein
MPCKYFRGQSTELGPCCLKIALEEVDQTIGGGVVARHGGGVLQLGLDRLCQLLAQLHTVNQTTFTNFIIIQGIIIIIIFYG